jgi:hypothetical protein
MLSPAEVIVEVMSPTSGKQLSFRIVNTRIETVSTITGSLPMEDCYTTFCVPPLQWWIDVHFACSNIQMCTSKEEAEDYHRRHGFHNGEVMDLNTLWELSKVGCARAYYCRRKLTEILRLGIVIKLATSMRERRQAKHEAYLKVLEWSLISGLSIASIVIDLL